MWTRKDRLGVKLRVFKEAENNAKVLNKTSKHNFILRRVK